MTDTTPPLRHDVLAWRSACGRIDPVFDGLYEYRRRGLLLDRPPA